MQMSKKMHDESGEAETRRAREGELLLGWVCGCQTKTSGGQVENTDYTEWSAGVKEQRGPEHRGKDLKLVQSVVQKWKRAAWQRKCSDRGELTFSSHVGWLTDFTINSWRQYLTSGSLVHSLPHLPTSSHSISYTHIDKGAAKLMLMWPLDCTCTALTLSAGGKNGQEWLWWISHLQPWHPLQSILSCMATPVHTAQAWVTEYRLICSSCNSGIWKTLRCNSTQILF